MAMNEHPREDDIPAFELGALDAEEARQISEHMSICPVCRATAERFRVVVSLLPYAAPPRDPPQRVKRRLLARIAAVVEEAVR